MIPILVISNSKKALDKYITTNFKRDANLFSEVIPSTKEYSIEDIKDLIKETKVFHPKTRIYFLADFHLSSIPAQNSFLKLLEEPPTNVQFILSTDNKNRLLPTIISRVKIIKLKADQIFLLNKVIQDDLSELIESKSLKILNKSNFSQLKRDDSLVLLNQIIMFFREKLASDKNSPAIMKEILRLKSLLENNNLNPQLTIDQMLIFIYKQYKMKS
jgi:DNA polymerase III subunit delta'